MIRYVTPYDINGNLNRAYNKEIYRGGGYVCFTDRDTLWPHPEYAKQIYQIIQKHPNHYYTCYTNRINCSWQRWHIPGNEIPEHRRTAEVLWDRFGDTVEDCTGKQLWSGHVMICPTHKWKHLEEDKLLGVDNDIHRNVRERDDGTKILLMKGIYIYHYYSNYDGPWETASRDRDKSHLK